MLQPSLPPNLASFTFDLLTPNFDRFVTALPLTRQPVKLGHWFSKYLFHKFGNGRKNGRTDGRTDGWTDM